MALTSEVQAERDRCARMVSELAEVWTAIAAKVRKDGEFTTREAWPPPFRKVTCVRPNYERYATHIDDAVAGLRTLEKVMRGL